MTPPREPTPRCTSADIVRRFYAARMRRNALRAERGDCLCERSERGPAVYVDVPGDFPNIPDPCWKAARTVRQNNIGEEFRVVDPPESEWCASCQKREALSREYRKAVQHHGAMLRGLIRHGKSLQEESRDAR